MKYAQILRVNSPFYIHCCLHPTKYPHHCWLKSVLWPPYVWIQFLVNLHVHHGMRYAQPSWNIPPGNWTKCHGQLPLVDGDFHSYAELLEVIQPNQPNVFLRTCLWFYVCIKKCVCMCTQHELQTAQQKQLWSRGHDGASPARPYRPMWPSIPWWPTCSWPHRPKQRNYQTRRPTCSGWVDQLHSPGHQRTTPPSHTKSQLVTRLSIYIYIYINMHMKRTIKTTD